MKILYLIKVYDRINEWSNSLGFVGYYKGTYNVDGGTFIGYSATTPDITDLERIKIYKTRKSAESAIDKLKSIVYLNGYLNTMVFEIADIDESNQLVKDILSAIDKAKQERKNKSIKYVGVSVNYLNELLEVESAKISKVTGDTKLELIQSARIDLLREIISTIEEENKYEESRNNS